MAGFHLAHSAAFLPAFLLVFAPASTQAGWIPYLTFSYSEPMSATTYPKTWTPHVALTFSSYPSALGPDHTGVLYLGSISFSAWDLDVYPESLCFDDICWIVGIDDQLSAGQTRHFRNTTVSLGREASFDPVIPIDLLRWSAAKVDEKRDPWGNLFLEPYLRYSLTYFYFFNPRPPRVAMIVTETWDGSNLSFRYRSQFVIPEPRLTAPAAVALLAASTSSAAREPTIMVPCARPAAAARS